MESTHHQSQQIILIIFACTLVLCVATSHVLIYHYFERSTKQKIAWFAFPFCFVANHCQTDLSKGMGIAKMICAIAPLTWTKDFKQDVVLIKYLSVSTISRRTSRCVSVRCLFCSNQRNWLCGHGEECVRGVFFFLFFLYILLCCRVIWSQLHKLLPCEFEHRNRPP